MYTNTGLLLSFFLHVIGHLLFSQASGWNAGADGAGGKPICTGGGRGGREGGWGGRWGTGRGGGGGGGSGGGSGGRGGGRGGAQFISDFTSRAIDSVDSIEADKGDKGDKGGHSGHSQIGNSHSFTVGDRVCHPTRGVGTVVPSYMGDARVFVTYDGIEGEGVEGETHRYTKKALAEGKLTLSVRTYIV